MTTEDDKQEKMRRTFESLDHEPNYQGAMQLQDDEVLQVLRKKNVKIMTVAALRGNKNSFTYEFAKIMLKSIDDEIAKRKDAVPDAK
jgi:hypothetical protein